MIKKKKTKDNLNTNTNNKLNKLKENIINYKEDLPIEFKKNHIKVETNSWFNIKEYQIHDNNERPENIKVNTKFKKTKIMRCQKVKMILDNSQKKILDIWFNAFTKTYNEAVRYIKSNYGYAKNNINENTLKNNDLYDIYNYYTLRKKLKQIKKDIQNEYKLTDVNGNNDIKIRIHNLDYAIKQLCTNIEAAHSNLKENNIKKFRIKYWRNDRVSKTIDIEKSCIKNDKICYDIFGDIKYKYNNKDYELCNLDCDIKINYNKTTDSYILLIPIKEVNRTIEDKKHNLISLDPGLRTFMTGVSEDGFIKIGDKVNAFIGESIYRLNNIKNNKFIKKKIKKKNEKMINRKIMNRIDDLHWKTINYLTQNYTTILLGDMSAKNIVKKNNSVLNNIQKVACLRTRYYDFSRKLEYKCGAYNVNYKKIDESYTSKSCSYCGNVKNNLGGAKIYNCKTCNINIDRDVNGSRNIYFKSITKKPNIIEENRQINGLENI